MNYIIGCGFVFSKDYSCGDFDKENPKKQHICNYCTKLNRVSEESVQ